MSNKKKTPINKGSKPPVEEVFYSVKKVNNTELRAERITVVDGQVTKREEVASDIVSIVRSKLWKTIYQSL